MPTPCLNLLKVLLFDVRKICEDSIHFLLLFFMGHSSGKKYQRANELDVWKNLYRFIISYLSYISLSISFYEIFRVFLMPDIYNY